MTSSIPLWKAAATAGGASLTGAAVWLNAEHIATAEGWASPLVLAGVITTVCAALTPPAAERVARDGQPLKAVALWAFFGLAVAFSLTASVARSGGHRDAEVAGQASVSLQARLAMEAYEDAKTIKQEECKNGHTSKCRKAEDALTAARSALATAPRPRVADPGAERIANILGVSEASVALYSPLALPLGMELGGFIFLATGLAPRRREARNAAVTRKARRKTKARPRGKSKSVRVLPMPALRLGAMGRG
jgi:hypothetical protein